MIKKTYIFGGLQLLITFLVGAYIESISSNNLLFTKGILADDLRQEIIANPFKVLLFLGFLNLFFFVASHRDREKKEKKILFDNICQIIFDKFIRKEPTLENSNIRVSLFAAQKKIIFRKEKFFLPEFRTVLVNEGRYQTRQEKKYCKLRFLPGEGAVGNSYMIGQLIFVNTIAFSKKEENEYYNQQYEQTKLPIHKIKKLAEKSSSIVCCPIKYFKSDELFGVIVVDSIYKDRLLQNHFRSIEEVLHNYSALFNQKIS